MEGYALAFMLNLIYPNIHGCKEKGRKLCGNMV